MNNVNVLKHQAVDNNMLEYTEYVKHHMHKPRGKPVNVSTMPMMTAPSTRYLGDVDTTRASNPPPPVYAQQPHVLLPVPPARHAELASIFFRPKATVVALGRGVFACPLATALLGQHTVCVLTDPSNQSVPADTRVRASDLAWTSIHISNNPSFNVSGDPVLLEDMFNLPALTKEPIQRVAEGETFASYVCSRLPDLSVRLHSTHSHMDVGTEYAVNGNLAAALNTRAVSVLYVA